MKQVLKFCWHWSWLVTTPIVVLFCIWLILTWDRFWTFGIRYDTAPFTTRLSDIGVMELNNSLRQLQLALQNPLQQTSTTATTTLKQINLFAPNAEIRKLNTQLPHSGYGYVKGSLYTGNNIERVKIRYRGDYFYHWALYKKSLRIKTRKNQLYQGMRRFNLIAPKVPSFIHTQLSYELARYLDLLAPHSEMVEVNINGKRMGVYELVEQLSETTLRRQQRMPGDIYSGELVQKDEVIGVPNNVFHSPWFWEKTAVNNHYPEQSRAPLAALLELLKRPAAEHNQRRLSELLDMAAWGRFSAFETLTQSFHFDNVHNWRLYYDPAKERFEPVVWDPMGWLGVWRPLPAMTTHLDVMPSELHQALFYNADFLQARHNALADFFSSGLARAFLRDVDQLIATVTPAVKRDPYLIFLTYIPHSPTQVLAAIDAMRTTIHQVFAEVEEALLKDSGTLLYRHQDDVAVANDYQLRVTGRTPIQALHLHYLSPIAQPPTVSIGYRRNGQQYWHDVSGAVSIQGSQLTLNTRFSSDFERYTRHLRSDNLQYHLKSKPGYYTLRVRGVATENMLISMEANRAQAGIQRASQQHTAWQNENTEFAGLYNLVQDQSIEQDKPLLWRGQITISGVQRLSKTLVIEPGTEVRFQPGATLILQGRLLAEGTADNPIRFLPATGDEQHETTAWGALVLKGTGASGSILRHCQMSGGSGLKDDLYEYSAMLSIHNVQDVVIDHCQLKNNYLVDDMVHAVYTDLTITNSLFENAYLDAVDLDNCNAHIQNSHFHNSGNDGLDLMESAALINNSQFTAGGDKGISIGEHSEALILSSKVHNNQTGIAVKDRSVAVLHDVLLLDNQTSLHAFKKNWQYGDGGYVYAYQTSLEGTGAKPVNDQFSRIDIRQQSAAWDKEIAALASQHRLARLPALTK